MQASKWLFISPQTLNLLYAVRVFSAVQITSTEKLSLFPLKYFTASCNLFKAVKSEGIKKTKASLLKSLIVRI